MSSLSIFMIYHYPSSQAVHRITPVNHSNVIVEFYTSGSRDLSKPENSMEMSFIQFRNWFHMNWRFLEVDKEPINNLELMFPLMPSVIIQFADLPRMRSDVQMALKFTEDQWVLQRASTPVTLELVDEREEGEEEEGEGEERKRRDQEPPSPTDSG